MGPCSYDQYIGTTCSQCSYQCVECLKLTSNSKKCSSFIEKKRQKRGSFLRLPAYRCPKDVPRRPSVIWSIGHKTTCEAKPSRAHASSPCPISKSPELEDF
ncbi:hypothetical protein M758_7G086000 [Ceratodon purpureus]|nr:hypothetical protein M758_7G086000 [Ceratodon purpureus]